MKNIVVIFGGRSVEHDISILTGLHAAKHVEGYRVHYVYLTRENQMMTGENLSNPDCYTNEKLRARAKMCHFADGCLIIRRRTVKIKAILNCCHGGVGEGGELSAYLNVAKIPVTSCNHITAATLQSKARTREILSANGYRQPKWKCINTPTANIDLLFPVIIKPDTLGSSIGISIANNETELDNALAIAFSLDKKVVVEEYLSDITEINCSAMRVGNEVIVSQCEEIHNKNKFFDFNTKYLDSGSGFIKKGKNTEADAKKQKLFEKIRELTKKAYELFDARGVIRADFMISNGKIYLNEINTVPGFLAYHLWARTGIPYGVVIDGLIKQAVKDFHNQNTFVTTFQSDILKKNRGLVR